VNLALALREAVPGLAVRDGSARDEYGSDEGFARRGVDMRPDAVAAPTSTAQVSALLRFASDKGVPVVPWGSGTSLEGQALATAGGLTLDMRGLNRIGPLLLDDFQVEVQAGATHPDLDKWLKPYGVFFPPNPGAPATIGGMIANNSSGSRAVKYGVTRDYVQRLEVVLADGTVTRIGSRAAKSSSGYDLLHLVVGSEGTLCVVTAATLRVLPRPSFSRGLVARFSDLGSATALVQACLGSGFQPATLELLDERVVQVLAAHSPLPPGPGVILLIDCDGSDAGVVDAEVSGIGELVAAQGGELLPVAPREFGEIMKARKTLGWEVVRESGVRTLKLLDIAVPISKYGGTVSSTYDVLDANGLRGFILGHAGDGNLHVLIASDWRDEDLWSRTLAAEEQIVDLALAVDGTITGEHGIGAAKRHLLRKEHGAAVDLMQGIKNVFDPLGIMNPGKVLPPMEE
jgi:D-lactate dehydrogenase (cytochrome)